LCAMWVTRRALARVRALGRAVTGVALGLALVWALAQEPRA